MVFRSSDTSPKEVNIYHGAGARGTPGSASCIDAMILRDFDSTGDYESGTADGVLQDRYYHCHPRKWRQDTAALVEVAGASTTRLSEQVRYSAYGMPFGLPKGDADVDGETKVADETQIQTWISGSQYHVRGDVDLDGVVDGSDESIVSVQIGAVLGRTKLSTNPDNGIGNRHGYASYQHDRTITRNHVRHRVYDPDTGRWTRRKLAQAGASVEESTYASNAMGPTVLPAAILPSSFSQCRSNVACALQDPRVKSAIDSLRQSGCVIPHIQCTLDACGTIPAWRHPNLGGADFNPNELPAHIRICPNGWPGGSSSWSCEVVTQMILHELVHARQWCLGTYPAMWWANSDKRCEDLICAEIQAAYSSQQCVPGIGADNSPPCDTEFECLLRITDNKGRCSISSSGWTLACAKGCFSDPWGHRPPAHLFDCFNIPADTRSACSAMYKNIPFWFTDWLS